MSFIKKIPDKDIKKIRCRLLVSGICCVLMLVLFIWQSISLGWFANNSSVDAAGLSVEVRSSQDIIVKKTADGNDITNELITIDTTDETKMHPGSFGSFTAYISTNPSVDLFSFHIDCYTRSVGANNSVNEITDEAYANYIKTHLAFFLTYEDSSYSDWIVPDEGITINSTTSNYELTVYWVWIETYDELNSAKFDVGEHYKTVDNMPMWFSGLPNQTSWNDSPGYYSDYYNNADFEIGEGLNGEDICFTIDVSLS